MEWAGGGTAGRRGLPEWTHLALTREGEPMTISITLTATDPRPGTTLAEVERFVQRARAAGAADGPA